jgi:hypothetical protein
MGASMQHLRAQYRCRLAVHRHREQRMRPIRSKQSDLFAEPAPTPTDLPATMRPDLVGLLCGLMLEVMSYQRSLAITAQREGDHEQQDHA